MERSDEEAAIRVPDSYDGEQAAIFRERARMLSESIRGLPVTDRQIIQLHLEGLSYAEIQEVTGLSEANVGARLTRIRQRLREVSK